MRKLLALLIGKLVYRLSYNLRLGGGTAAPGLIALKIYPNLIEDFSSQIKQTIIITGTNGKTTTARLLAHIAKASGLRVLRNYTGSNLSRGIASAILSGFRFRDLILGRKFKDKYDLAIWELDEAAFVNLAPKLKPNIIVFLNALRDQLDRYGEVDSVVAKWSESLQKITSQPQILFNGDDGNLLSLSESFNGSSLFFGIPQNKIAGEKSSTKSVEYFAQGVDLSPKKLEGIQFTLKLLKENFSVYLPIPGRYNVYNFLAAISVSKLLNLSIPQALVSLKEFLPAFGRVEQFVYKQKSGEEKKGYILLIKNPTGANQVFQIAQEELEAGDSLLLALNDNLADGTDVSWIWDANFELLQNLSQTQSKDLKIYASGTRAQDLALRLKYAGFQPSEIVVNENLEKVFLQAIQENRGKIFILPTYSALLEIQKTLTRQGIKKHYWKNFDL